MSETTPTKKTTGAMDSSPAGSGLLAGKTLLVTGVLMESSIAFHVASSLGEAALAFARDAGFRSMQFNAVVESNANAVALWRKLGFEIIGTVPEAFDHPLHGLVGLHVMYRPL